MKVYLDDERFAPDGWQQARWPEDAIRFLETGMVTHISLDHDLGDDDRGLAWFAESDKGWQVEKEPYMKVVDLVDKATHQAKGWADFTKTNASFYTFIPPKSVQHLGGRRQPDMVFTTVNHVGHIALNGMFSNYTYLPIWLDEGFGVWLENATLKQSLTRTYTIGYGMVAPRKDKWSASANWKGNLKDAVADASILSLDRLVVMKLNAMGWMEIAKAWSIIDWWITTDREKFLRFIKEVRRRYPQANKHQECSPSDFKRFQNEAMKAVYGKDVVKIEKDWRNYVSTSY